jgi:hypothetical protein
MSRRARPAEERFWERIEKDQSTGCWNFRARYYSRGYAQFSVSGNGSDGSQVRVYAHRYSWELHRGPIPAGLSLDHRCRNTICCNPDHLEPVSLKENVLRSNGVFALNARKAMCKRGHQFTPQNTYSKRPGERRCRTCRADQHRAKRNAAA